MTTSADSSTVDSPTPWPRRSDGAADTVVLIHGLWMTARSWEHWVERYTQQGYRVIARSWPGMEGDIDALLGATASDARESAQTRPKPTVVLVHGAFADASSWSAVVSRLQRAGYPVVAPANPLRGLASDAAYVSSFLATLSGPVVLVGHSYGGAVITNAAVQHANVTALVYIAAYIPDTGQALKDLTPLPGSLLVPSALVLRPWTLADGSTGVDVSIDPRQFRTIFAADLPEEQTAVMAASQRPLSAQALFEPSAAAAWQTIPSWALVATQDNAIGTANVRAMAQHAHAHMVEVAGSHAVLLSRPDAVVRLIRAAARNDD